MISARQKVVNIQLASEDLERLKKGHYLLCFAKKVNDSFNVVWRASDKYLSNNTFTWTPAYQVFGSNTFQTGIPVKISTNRQNISLGEISILDHNGILQPATPGEPAHALTIDNQYEPIHLGVNALGVGIDGESMSTPIYVTEQKLDKGLHRLIPAENILVWFEQDIMTGTMFSGHRPLAVEIDMMRDDKITYIFRDGNWQPVSLNIDGKMAMEAEVGPTLLHIIVTTTTVISGSLLARKIEAKLTDILQDVQVSVDPTMEGKMFTIKYSERSGIGFERTRYLSTLKQSPTLPDTLTSITAEALASLNTGFVTLKAATDVQQAAEMLHAMR